MSEIKNPQTGKQGSIANLDMQTLQKTSNIKSIKRVKLFVMNFVMNITKLLSAEAFLACSIHVHKNNSRTFFSEQR